MYKDTPDGQTNNNPLHEALARNDALAIARATKGRLEEAKNKPKGYDGNNLRSAENYYSFSAESWSEIIRFEEGLDEAFTAAIAIQDEIIKYLEANPTEK